MTTFERIAAKEGGLIQLIARFGSVTLEQGLSKRDFYALAESFPELRIERNKNGKTTIMSPVKFGSGKRESMVNGYLFSWWMKKKSGETFSSSTGIELPDGSIKSPDCGWISRERLANITAKEEEDNFLQVVPDFIVEVKSKTDRITNLKRKMVDAWIKNGVRLAWLIDPYKEKAYIYRANGEIEIIEGFKGKKLRGEDVLLKMELPLEELRIKKTSKK